MASPKPYPTIIHLLIITITITITIPSSSSSSSPSPSPSSVFDILPQYGLPKGLLPSCIKSYTLDPTTGKFVVNLEQTCYVQFEYLVYYEKTISGTLKVGSITDLKGIQVKRFLFWFDVDEIKVDLPPSGSIYFQVGIINKKLSVDQFSTVHSCQSKVNLGHLFQLPPPVDEEISMLLTE